jgi:hypothetical protein
VSDFKEHQSPAIPSWACVYDVNSPATSADGRLNMDKLERMEDGSTVPWAECSQGCQAAHMAGDEAGEIRRLGEDGLGGEGGSAAAGALDVRVAELEA